MKGFQRALREQHWQEISEYFEDPKNISPTAVVIAFKPDGARITELQVELKSQNNKASAAAPTKLIRDVLLEVTLPDYSSVPLSHLAKQIATELRSELGTKQSDTDDEVEDEGEQSTPSNLLSVHESHLREFITSLEDNEELRKAELRDADATREALVNLLKPATIVDGQHRTHGAAFLEMGILFPVVALLDAPWPEQVYQFVVINQKAEPIEPAFLSAIISSSLSQSQIDTIRSRLEDAGISLDETKILNLIQSNAASPFYGMLDLGVQGATGHLKYSGMINLGKRFRGLKTHVSKDKGGTSFRVAFEATFASACSGTKYKTQRDDWLNSKWYEFFFAFWNRVKERLAIETKTPALWESASNLLKVVTLQELQNLFVFWLINRRTPITDVGALRSLIDEFMKNLTHEFFILQWKAPSLQSGTGRELLRSELSTALMDSRYKFTGPLFHGISAASKRSRK